MNSTSGASQSNGSVGKDEANVLFAKSWESVGPMVNQAYESLEERVVEMAESASQSIKKYPIQSLLIGFGAGCLAALLFRSTKN